MRDLRRWSLVLLALVASNLPGDDRLLAQQQPRIFYVSPQGDDARPGTSPESAWKTVRKVNETALAPGDRVRFARGGEWRESLAASSSGSRERPIVFEAYGQGKKPRFWGSDLLANRDFRAADALYQCDLAGRAGAVLVDQRFLVAADQASIKTTPGSWFHDGKTLMLNVPSDPRVDSRLYTVCRRVDLINSNGKDHLIFRNLVGDESADPRDGYAFRVMGSRNVLLEGCEAYRAGRHHFGAINSTEFIGRRLHCAQAMPLIPGGATFYVSFSDASRQADTHRWEDCTAAQFENPGQGNYQVFYNHGEGLGPIVIENLRAAGGKFSVSSSQAGPLTIRGGQIDDASLEFFGSHLHVDGLTMTGRSAVDCFGSQGLFENLRLVDITVEQGGVTGYSSAIVLRDGARQNTVRFSTIVLDAGAPDWATCLAFVGEASQTRSHGNLLVSRGRVAKAWKGKLAAHLLSDFNLYPTNGTFAESNDQSVGLADWRKQGADKNSLSADPRFRNPSARDYSLGADSPAIGAAKLPAADGPALDAEGRPRGSGARTMGALEPAKEAPR